MDGEVKYFFKMFYIILRSVTKTVNINKNLLFLSGVADVVTVFAVVWCNGGRCMVL